MITDQQLNRIGLGEKVKLKTLGVMRAESGVSSQTQGKQDIYKMRHQVMSHVVDFRQEIVD